MVCQHSDCHVSHNWTIPLWCDSDFISSRLYILQEYSIRCIPEVCVILCYHIWESLKELDQGLGGIHTTKTFSLILSSWIESTLNVQICLFGHCDGELSLLFVMFIIDDLVNRFDVVISAMSKLHPWKVKVEIVNIDIRNTIIFGSLVTELIFVWGSTFTPDRVIIMESSNVGTIRFPRIVDLDKFIGYLAVCIQKFSYSCHSIGMVVNYTILACACAPIGWKCHWVFVC